MESRQSAALVTEGNTEYSYQDHSADDLINSFSSKGEPLFPVKLHYMLSEIDKDGLSSVISWQPHGRCFIVRNRKEFVKRFLPCWFRMSQFTSFQRQLNLYGFRRQTVGLDKGAYHHELFLRSRQDLAGHIQRVTVKGRGGRKPDSIDTEPDFYSMPFLPSSTDKKHSITNPQNDSFCKQDSLLALTSSQQQSKVQSAQLSNDCRIAPTSYSSFLSPALFCSPQHLISASTSHIFQNQDNLNISKNIIRMTKPAINYATSASLVTETNMGAHFYRQRNETS